MNFRGAAGAPDKETYSEEEKRKLEETMREMKETMKSQFRTRTQRDREFSPRILLVGPSGAGKSTLVNTVFGLGERERAEVRAGGTPCTTKFTEYGPFEKIPIYIIDSQGIEREEAEFQRDKILEYVRLKNNDINASNHVHIAWYVPGERWEGSDITYVKELSKVINVVVVISKCDERQQIDPKTGKTALELTRLAIDKSVPDIDIVECGKPAPGSQHWVPRQCGNRHSIDMFTISNARGTWNCDAKMGDGFCDKKGRGSSGPFGFVDLVDKTLKSLPEVFRSALRRAQVVDMKRKNEEAAGIIVGHTLTAMGIGATSIPFSDLPLLLGLEATMGALLFNVYDVDPEVVNADTWIKLNVSVGGAVGFIGSAAAKAMKAVVFLAPAGAVIDAMVAGVIVGTLGITIAIVCSNLPPRTGSDVDRDMFATSLRETASTISLEHLVKAAFAAFSSGDTGGVQLANDFQGLLNGRANNSASASGSSYPHVEIVD